MVQPQQAASGVESFAISRLSGAGIRYIQFSELVGGQGTTDLVTHLMHSCSEKEDNLLQWSHMCNPFQMIAMRDLAYRNFGLKVCYSRTVHFMGLTENSGIIAVMSLTLISSVSEICNQVDVQASAVSKLVPFVMISSKN